MIRARLVGFSAAILCLISIILLPTPKTTASVALSSAGGTANGTVDLASRPTDYYTNQIRVLMYSTGVMERVARCHMNPRCGDSGDYVPTLRLRRDVTGYTAVNWANRKLVAQNVVIVAQLYDSVRRTWYMERLQPTDWQQLRHATGWRLEVDGKTAARLHFYNQTTVARIVKIER